MMGTIAPRFGVAVLPTDRTLSPPDIAIAAEQRGLDMLFFPESSHVPVARNNSYPVADGRLQSLARLHDSFVALAACAAVTTTIKLGIGVCLLTERDPIITAKAAASLDHISNGRLILGIAGGFMKEAMAHHGVAFKQRWDVVRDRAMAMKEIWSNDEAEYRGEFVNFGPSWSYPKPQQTGGPLLLIGSNSQAVPERVADYADGWMPIEGRYRGDPIADLRAACARRERDFERMTLLLFDAPTAVMAARDRIAQGFDGLVFFATAENGDDLLKELDHFAELAQQLRH